MLKLLLEVTKYKTKEEEHKKLRGVKIIISQIEMLFLKDPMGFSLCFKRL